MAVSLGQLSIGIQFDLRAFKGQAKYIQSMIGGLGKSMGKAIQPMSAEVGKGLNNVLTNFNNTGKQLDKSAKETGKRIHKGISSGIQKTRNNLISFGEFFRQIMHYITFSIGVQMVMGIKQAFTDMVETFKTFERAATNAATVSGALGKSFEKVKRHIMDVSQELGRETVYGANDVAEAFYNLASAGYDVSKMTADDLLPILNYAAATQASLEEATYAVTTALKAFNLEFDQAGRVADVFTGAIASSFLNFQRLQDSMRYVAPIAGTLNVGLEETVAVLATLADRGYQGGQAGQRLNMILTKLLEPTDKATKMLEGMGVSVESLNPETHTLVEILQRLRSAGFGAAEAAQMFRARTAAASAVIVENVNSISRYTNELKMTQGISEQVAQYQEKTLWGAFEKVGNILQETAIGIAEDLTPAFYGFIDTVRDTVVPVLQGVGAVFKFIIKNAGPIITLLKILIPLWLSYKIAMWLSTKVLQRYIATLIAEKPVLGFTLKQKATYIALTYQQAEAQALLNKTIMKNPYVLAGIAIGTIVGALALLALSSKETKLKLEELGNITFKQLNTEIGKTNSAIAELTKFEPSWFNIPYTDWGLSRNTKDLDNILNRLKLTKDEMEGITKFFKEETGIDVHYVSVRSGYHLDLSDLWNAIDKLKKMGKEFEIPEFGEALVKMDLSNEFLDINISVQKLTDSLKKEKIAMQAVEEVDTTDLEKLEEVQIALAIATDERKNAEIESFQSIKSFLNAVRKYSDASKQMWTGTEWVDTNKELAGILDEGVGYLEDAAKARNLLQEKTIDLENSESELEDKTRDLALTIAEYGRGSSETVDALKDYEKEVLTVSKMKEELIEINSDLSTAENNLKKLRKYGITDEKGNVRKLSEAEENLLEKSEQLITLREEYIDATVDSEMATLDLAAAKAILDRYTEIMNEKLKNYFEIQEKIYELESKIYKLRFDEKSQLDDLFQSLADQGFMTSEIAQAYGDMWKAQGDVWSLNQGYLGVLQDLTPEQRKLVEELINTTIGTDDYYEALQNVKDAGFLDEGELDLIMSYDQALETLKETTETFKNLLTPIVDSLVDIGAVSADTADKFYELIDNVAELIGFLYEQKTLSLDIVDNFNAISDTNVRLARSFQDEADEIESIGTVYGEWLEQLGITEEMGGDVTGFLSTLNDLFGTSNKNLTDFTDEQLVLGASLVQVAKNFGIYEEGMSAATIAEKLGAGSVDVLAASISQSLKDYESMFTITEDQEEALARETKAFEDLAEAIDLMTLALYSSQEGLLNFALSYQFSDTFIDTFDGEIDKFMNYLSGEGVVIDAAITGSWDTKDFEAYYDILMDAPDEIKDEFSNTFGSGIDLSSKDAFIDSIIDEDGVIEKAGALGNFFAGYQTFLKINPTWDGMDWSSFYNSTYSKGGDLANNMNGVFAENEIDIPVNEEDFITAMKALPPSGMVAMRTVMNEEDPSIVPIAFPDKEGWKTDMDVMLSNMQTYLDGNILVVSTEVDDTPPDKPKGSWLGNILSLMASLALPIFMQKGSITSSPQMAMIGEAGAEAVVPLEGANRKYGKSILEKIIPQYFPDLAFMQAGGVASDTIVGIRRDDMFSKMYSILQDIKDVLGSDIKDVLIGLPNDIKDTTGGYTPRMGISVPMVPTPVGGGEGEASASAGSLMAETDIRQGGKAVNVRIIVDANDFNSAILSFIDGVTQIIANLKETLSSSSKSFYSDISSAGIDFYTIAITSAGLLVDAGNAVKKAIDDVTPIKVVHTHTYSKIGFQQGGIFTSPTAGIFGEAGAEALVPLEGKNRKFGERILQDIIPKYYPDLMFQEGGIFATGGGRTYNDNSEFFEENYNIMGPVSINANNVSEFSEDLKYRYRMSR